eukprot:scaffold108146_cov32-Phaeocystis_antarctica.AAC.1
MLACATLWAAVCGLDGVWPSGGVWPREIGVEGRSRPKKAEGGHCGTQFPGRRMSARGPRSFSQPAVAVFAPGRAHLKATFT